jgi:guanylate kinase
MEQRKRGRLVIIIGPSAGGKTTIVDKALELHPSAVRLVTTTTRAMRPGEVDGVHYHFLDRPTFEQKLERGEFLEHNEFDGNLYGSSRIILEKMLREHDLVFAVLDVNGARKALHAFPEATSIFIRPDSIDQLRKRHEERGKTPDEVQWRLARAREEIAQAHDFGHVLTNHEGDVDGSVAEVLRIALGA